MAFLGLISSAYAQNDLTEEEIVGIAQKMETDWRFGKSDMIWMESASRFSQYMSTVSGRCPEELEFVLGGSERWHLENLRIAQVEKQIYPKPGSKKSEKNLSRYFKDTEKAITASMERTTNKAMRMTMIEDSIASANRL